MPKPTNMIPFTHFNTQMEGLFDLQHYQHRGENERLAVQLFMWDEDGNYLDRYSVISVNVPEEPLGDDEIFAKEWSESEGLVQQFIDAGFFEDTGRTITCGHVPNVRILKVNKEKINQHHI